MAAAKQRSSAAKQRSSVTRLAEGADAKPTKKATKRNKAAANAKRVGGGAKNPNGRGGNKSNGRAGKKAAGAAKKGSGGVAGKAVDALKPSGVKHPIRRIATTAALKGIKLLARKTLAAAGDGVRAAADKTAAAGKDALESGMSRRLPIQVSVDVAVPVEFAWDEWMQFGSFTEGVHRIEEIERDGDRLYGRTAGPMSADWEAEVVDEREHADFAWRSVEGSDCAGLASFRPLSDRLTRIQLELDVVPTNPAETFALSVHLAHRRAEAELRRFKARLEFTNPDVYEPELRKNGSEPEDQNEDEETT